MRPLHERIKDYVQALPPRADAESAMLAVLTALRQEDAILLESLRLVLPESFSARQAELARLQHDIAIVKAFATVLGGRPLDASPAARIPVRMPPAP